MGQTKDGAIKTAAKKAGISVGDYLKFVQNGLKKCTICKEWKLIKFFYLEPSRHDGFSSRCMDCSKVFWRIRSVNGPKRKKIVPGDKEQARHFINIDVKLGLRPNPNSLYCAICGHKGPDVKHEYHHGNGYSEERFYDVVALCVKCHQKEHRNGPT